MYRFNPTTNKNLELFLENLEKDLLNPKNIKNIDKTLEESYRILWKKSETGMNRQLEFKIKDQVKYQIKRSSFEELLESSNQKYENKVNNWVEEWYSNNSISEKWKNS